MLKRIAFIAFVVYMILFGATFDGILNPTRRIVDVLLFGTIVILWIVARRRWRWHRTLLDWPILLWCVAFVLSLGANTESWRRIVIGLWFMGAYIGIWYLLQDAFANGGLRRQWLVEALLIAGVPIIFVGYAQIDVSLTGGLPIPRPVGTLGNANALAAFLVMLLPFIGGRFVRARTALPRVLFGFYGVAALVLLMLTYSRGGWVGAAVAFVVWLVLSFPVQHVWASLPRQRKIVVVVVLVVVAVLGSFVMIKSFEVGGRGLEYRTWIYETALKLFNERPLTGHGLFTFGAGLSRLNSIPPLEPHSHAHNIVLNVAAELGIVGIAALVFTTWVIFRHARKPNDPIAVMAIAAFAGFATHQLFDMPVMMPAIALVALASLVLAIPVPTKLIRGRWQTAIVAVGSFALFLTGLWGALQYREYVSILSEGINSGDYQTAAARLGTLSAADPDLAIYAAERGMLLGLAATAGDAQSAQIGAASFARYVELEPNYVTGWANLAALYEQTGDLPQAADAMKQAAMLAPRSYSILYRAGTLAETVGDTDALAIYDQLLALNHDVALLPDWNDTVLRRTIPISEDEYSDGARTILFLSQGETLRAQQMWESNPNHRLDTSANHTIALILAQAQGDASRASAELQAARAVAANSNDRAWTNLGAALLNCDQYDSEIAGAKAALDVPLTESDWVLGANIAYIQYLHLAIPRVFLPQVKYSEADPLLLHLLSNTETLNSISIIMYP